MGKKYKIDNFYMARSEKPIILGKVFSSIGKKSILYKLDFQVGNGINNMDMYLDYKRGIFVAYDKNNNKFFEFEKFSKKDVDINYCIDLISVDELIRKCGNYILDVECKDIRLLHAFYYLKANISDDLIDKEQMDNLLLYLAVLHNNLDNFNDIDNNRFRGRK